jgi:hypothetical protein
MYMDEWSIEDILASHAEALNSGQRTWAATPGDESLRSLLAVAELVQKALVPVQPSPGFVRSLGKNLVVSTRHGRQALTARTRRAALIGAAVLGSLVSAASVVGIVAYMMRHRVRA